MWRSWEEILPGAKRKPYEKKKTKGERHGPNTGVGAGGQKDLYLCRLLADREREEQNSRGARGESEDTKENRGPQQEICFSSTWTNTRPVGPAWCRGERRRLHGNRAEGEKKGHGDLEPGGDRQEYAEKKLGPSPGTAECRPSNHKMISDIVHWGSGYVRDDGKKKSSELRKEETFR